MNQENSLHGAFCPAGSQLLLLHLFLGNFLFLGFRFAAGECLLLLDKADLDVTGRGHVRINPSVGTVSPPPHLRGAVHLNVFHNEMISVKSLVLSVALSILEEVE